MPSQLLVNVLTVTNLGAGFSVTVPHGLKVAGEGVVPKLVFPDRGTNIRVTAADDTNITFENSGASLEALVRFRVEYGLSNEVDSSTLTPMLYAGSSGSPSGGGSAGGGGGYTYYLNANAADLPEPTAGDRELSLTYSAVPATLGPTIPADSPAYTQLEEWVTDVGDPGATAIPPGIWQIGLQARASHSDGVAIRFKVSKWDGATLTTIATSDDDQITNTGGFALNNADVFVPYTALSATDRVVVTLEATKTVAANRTIEVSLGGTSPSHIHTSFGAPGGTGLVKVINGVVQDPASLLVNADVSGAAAIDVSKLAGGTNGYFLSTVLGVPTWASVAGAATTVPYRATAVATSLNAASDYLLETTSGPFAVTVPTAVGQTGRVFIVKNTSNQNIQLVASGGQTIDGVPNVLLSPFTSITIVSNGANWVIV